MISEASLAALRKEVGASLSEGRFLHTSGGEDMTVFDEIIFLADFVEDGRKYDACREIREELFSALAAEEKLEGKRSILRFQVFRVIDFTIYYLQRKGSNVNSRMLMARTSIGSKIIADL